jgi:hypothetical protein
MNKLLRTYTTANHDSAVFTQNGMLGKVVLYAGSTTAVVTFYDNAGTAASNHINNRVCKLTCPVASYEKSEEWLNGLEFQAGLYLLLTGTGAEVKVEKIAF